MCLVKNITEEGKKRTSSCPLVIIEATDEDKTVVSQIEPKL